MTTPDKYFSNVPTLIKTDEGDFETFTWVSHTGKIRIQDMTPIARIELIKSKGCGFHKGKELSRQHGYQGQQNVARA